MAIVDAVRSNRSSYWNAIVRPTLSVSNARSAHLLKPLALFLFPLANWIVYLDAKTTLTAPPVGWIREASGGAAGLVVLRHPHNPIEYAADGLVREIVQERRWVARRRRANWKTDVQDVDRLAQRYCALGPMCRIGRRHRVEFDGLELALPPIDADARARVRVVSRGVRNVAERAAFLFRLSWTRSERASTCAICLRNCTGGTGDLCRTSRARRAASASRSLLTLTPEPAEAYVRR